MRAAIHQEINHLINPIGDVSKFKNYGSAFKRHTIRRPIRPSQTDPHYMLKSKYSNMRKSAADYFFTYCRQVLPKLEDQIEL